MRHAPCPDCGSTAGPKHLCAAASLSYVGRLLDSRYQVEGILGQGGMGTVFKATQTSVRRPVAVKMLHPTLATSPSFFERFRREAELASKLKHPNIITIYDFGRTDDGNCFYVMELLGGESLKEKVKRDGPLPLGRAAHIIEQAARGLAHAHAHGCVHRDLKPHNIMVQNLDGADFVKVLDFGLVKALEEQEVELTTTGQVLGTPQYMAPEQALGEPVDQRSDLYALGAVFFFCLTGTSPYGAKSAKHALRAILQEPVPSVNSRRRGAPVPKAVDEFLRRVMAKEKKDRPQSAEVFVAELREALASVPRPDLDAFPDASGIQDSADSLRSMQKSARTVSERKGTPSRRSAAAAAPALRTASDHARIERVAQKPVPDSGEATVESTAYIERPKRPAFGRRAVAGLVLTILGGVGTFIALRPRPEPTPNPPKQAARVHVHLSSSPPGAAVFAGDAQLGTTPVSLWLERDKQHLVRLQRDGFEVATTSIALDHLDAAEMTLTVPLTPLPARPAKPQVSRKGRDIPVFE